MTSASAIANTSIDTERRSNARHVNVLQLALLDVANHLQLCLVLNVGQRGMKVRIFGAFDGDNVIVRLRGGEALTARVVWRDAQLIGLEFAEDCLDSLPLLTTGGRDGLSRAPRLKLDLKIVVRCGSQIRAGKIQNISPTGAKIQLPTLQVSHPDLHLRLPELGLVDAQVRWRSGSDVGVSFNRSLLFKELAQVVASSHVLCSN